MIDHFVNHEYVRWNVVLSYRSTFTNFSDVYNLNDIQKIKLTLSFLCHVHVLTPGLINAWRAGQGATMPWLIRTGAGALRFKSSKLLLFL